MSDVFFNPYVGKDYTNGGLFAKRIMVLGESHYCDEGCTDCGNCSLHRECINFTNDVMSAYLDTNRKRENWMRTFLKFERSLVGRETDSELTQKIWNSVIFYNYLQVAMGGPREAGTPSQYRQAENALFDIFGKYRPEYVIVWGKRLFAGLPNQGWKDCPEIVVDGTSIANGIYTPYNIKVMAVNHPSVGYSWDYWHNVIKEFLK